MDGLDLNEIITALLVIVMQKYTVSNQYLIKIKINNRIRIVLIHLRH